MSKTDTLLKPKLASYLQSTWYARWIIVTIVGVSFWFFPGVNREVIGLLEGLAIIYNLTLKIGDKVRETLLIDRPAMLFIDSFLALVLIIYSGGVSSPYLAILPTMIISSAYWYGSLTAINLGILQAAILIIYTYTVAGTTDLPKTFLVQMAIYITIGLYVGWLSRSERSERKELLALATEVENERHQLLTLVNNIGDAVFVIDTKGKVMIFNHAASELTGHDSMLKKSIKDLFAFQDPNNNEVKFDVKKLANMRETADLRLNAPDGSLINVHISFTPYLVDRIQKGYVLIIRDITKDKTIEQERKEFIAVAAHELRTPLTIAQGDVSFMLSPPFVPSNPEAVHMLNGAMRSLKQLSHIISDLTSLSKVDSESLDVKLEPLNPLQLLKDLKSDFNDQAKAKGISLITKIDRNIDLPVILTSRYVVQEIMTTLVSNALKFTDEGSVTVSLEYKKDKPEGVTFSVKDTGIGISHSDQKKIFKKFFQSEDYMTRVHGGTGLGLYIAKKLAERLTAKLWFDTELGKGSIFYLWIPNYSQDKKDQGEVASAEAKEFFNEI